MGCRISGHRMAPYARQELFRRIKVQFQAQHAMKYISSFLVLILILALTGCDKPVSPVAEPPLDLSNGMLVLNEGTFNWGNASLSFLDNTGEVHHNVFEDANEIPLGDVAQSMVQIDSFVFIVVNNSGRINKLNLKTGKIERQLENLTSPRYILPIDNNKAYISDLYSSTLTIVNPNTLTITGEIVTEGWTEEMILIGNEAWVTKMGTDQILIIDTQTDAIVDSIEVGREPNSIVEDVDGDVWVLCSGGIEEEIPELVRVNKWFRTVEERFEFGTLQENPNRLKISRDGEFIYYLDEDLFRMGIRDTNLAASAFIEANQRTFYNFSLQEPFLWVTDAVDFVQSGSLLRYDLTTGDLQTELDAGTIPSEILVTQ